MSVPAADDTPTAGTPARPWFQEEIQENEVAVRGYLKARFPSVDPDDVVQESYRKLLKMRAAEKIASAKAYFFSIARNTALTFFRRQRIYSEIPISELPPSLVIDEACDPSEITYSRERLELVVAAIDVLPTRCREVMELALLHGLSSAEISQKLGIAESTVRVQLVKGVQRCSEWMRRKGERP